MVGEPGNIKSLINRVLDGVKFKYSRSKLHHILGDFYRLSGQFEAAIESYEISRKEAVECFDSLSQDHSLTNLVVLQLKWLEFASWFDVGLCKLDLLELGEAAQLFEISKSKISNYNYDGHVRYKNLCASTVSPFLVYTNLLLGFSEKASHFAHEAYCEFSSNLLGLTNQAGVLIFLGEIYNNLGEVKKSSEMYQKLIIIANQLEKPLLKSRAFRGLAAINRKQQDFAKAFSYHSEEISLLLENMGTKCDLAEAHYQLGLTHQVVGDGAAGYAHFQEAIRLFSEMEAPKQVELVRQSMQN